MRSFAKLKAGYGQSQASSYLDSEYTTALIIQRYAAVSLTLMLPSFQEELAMTTVNLQHCEVVQSHLVSVCSIHIIAI